jgi:(p)ppGpp synthase/HD superfamily hydrolase
VVYARWVHRGQRRQVDGAPFIEHSLEVALLLYRAGAPDHVIAAGVLHDVLETTRRDRARPRTAVWVRHRHDRARGQRGPQHPEL